MSFRVLGPAAREVERIARRYDAERAGLGSDFITELRSAYRLVAEDPGRHPRIKVPGTNRRFHRYRLRRFRACAVIYEILSSETVVVAVAHGRRRPFYWKGRK
jgi:plasmid stabilization system protein ParE